jgi:hypothetical protein
MAKLKKRVGHLFETEADLGEIDDEGNEVLKKDDSDDEEDYDELDDFNVEDLEGLIDNMNIDGDEDNARLAF